MQKRIEKIKAHKWRTTAAISQNIPRSSGVSPRQQLDILAKLYPRKAHANKGKKRKERDKSVPFKSFLINPSTIPVQSGIMYHNRIIFMIRVNHFGISHCKIFFNAFPFSLKIIPESHFLSRRAFSHPMSLPFFLFHQSICIL